MTSPTPASPVTASSANTHRLWVDIVKYSKLNLVGSTLLLLPGLLCMLWATFNMPYHAPLRLGLDFVGGTLLEYRFDKHLEPSATQAIANLAQTAGLKHPVVQVQEPHAVPQSNKATGKLGLTVNPKAPNAGSLVSLRTEPVSTAQQTQLEAQLKQQFGPFSLLQKNAIGPTLAKELLSNSLLALGLAYLLITGYLTWRFQLDYALCAMVALVHDTLFVLGLFSLLGVLTGTAVDSLFITGLLTVIGFSVHDTIVVFDRLRENTRLLASQRLPFAQVVNISVNQTLVRSINTSMTALLPLVALFLFGGDSTRDLVLCMAVGILVGTYSSIFIASILLALWRQYSEGGAGTTTTDTSTKPHLQVV